MITMQQFVKKTGVRFNVNMSGKMEGVNCLSTSNLCNRFCAARKGKEGCICSKCFADTTCKRYAALNENMRRNTEILTASVIPVKDWPLINAAIFRLESFGDLNNAIQCINYFNLCKANPHVRFALWTKNPGFVKQALQTETKPANLVIILSSAMIDQPCDATPFPFVDKTFTVYRKESMPESSINCGSRSCLACQRCYKKTTAKEIREYLK